MPPTAAPVRGAPTRWLRRLLPPPECRRFRRDRARLAADPLVCAAYAVAGSAYAQQLLAEHGGSVAAMLTGLSPADRELLGTRVAQTAAEA